MLIIFWSPFGFLLVRILAKRYHFDAGFFCSEIPQEIDRIRPKGTAEDIRRRVALHLDNASPRTVRAILVYLESHQMKRAFHPPFSPDLAISDFYLFDKLEIALMWEKFGDECGILDDVMRLLDDISRDELEAIFEE
jgi:histone-lysine N-methyltransferase SETMAR